MKSKINIVLNEAQHQLRQLKDPFYIIGSAALVLLGVENVNISDIDILTSQRDAEYLKDVWSERRIDNTIMKDDELFKSNFSRYRFSKFDIEVMGELKVQIENEWLPLLIDECETVLISDHITNANETFAIKIPTLQEQLKILKWFGREKDLEKVSLLNKHILKF